MNPKDMPPAMKKTKIKVNTTAGISESRLPALLRIIALANIGVLLIQISNLLGIYLLEVFNNGGQGDTAISSDRIALLLVSTVCAAAMGFGEIWFGGLSARREEQRLRQKLMRKAFALRLPIKQEIGAMVHLYTDSIERFCEYRQAYLGPAKAALLFPFLVLAYVAVCVDWLAGTVLLLMCPIIPLAIGGFMRLFGGRSRRSRKQQAQLSAKYLEALQTLSTLRLFGAAAAKEEELRTEGEKNRLIIMRILAGNQIVIIIMDGLFSVLFTCMAVCLAVWRAQAGAIWIGEALQIIFLSVLLLEPLQQVAGFFYIGMGGRAAQQALRAYQQKLDTGRGANNSLHLEYQAENAPELKIENTIVPNQESLEGESQPPSNPTPSVLIKDLDFAYDSQLPVLKGVNLEVPAGRKVALIGESGGGKTTLLHLLQGRLAPDRGSVQVGGKSAAVVAGLSTNPIALVSQTTWLFTGSIADNLRIAKAEANAAEMWESLGKAGLADFVSSLPQGLETAVGEDGSYLSGGQAQRLSLARAFLSGRKLLILDEPTSQLDTDTEKQFINTLAGIGPEYTVLIATHRYQLLQVADSAYSLAQGRLESVNIAEFLADYVAAEGERAGDE